MPGEWQIEIVLNRLFGSPSIQGSEQQGSAQTGRNVYIAQREDMQIVTRVPDGSRDPLGILRPEQILDKSRCVGDDNSQEAPRDTRSCLMRSAAGRPRDTRSLLETRANTSAGGGRATSLSRTS